MNHDDAQPVHRDTSLSRDWKRMFANLFWVGLAGMILQAVLIGLASGWWFADLFTHFRVQGVLLGLVLLVMAIALGNRNSAVALVLLVGLHIWVLFPYLPTNSQAPLSPDARTLLAWNVYAGNGRHDEILSLIRDAEADVVLLQEVTPGLGMKLQALREQYPVVEFSPSSDAFGIAVLSKKPFKEVTIQRIGEELFNTVVAKFDDGVTFVGVHTLPPAGAHYSRIRNQQLRELAEFVTSQEGPAIVAGDLNVSPWSPHFRQFIRDTSMTDTRRGRGLLNSWPSHRLLTRIPIDHVLVTGEIEVGELKVLSDSHGSDHFPVYVHWQYQSRSEKNFEID